MVLKRDSPDDGTGPNKCRPLRMVNHSTVFGRLDGWAKDLEGSYLKNVIPVEKYKAVGNPIYEQQKLDGDARLANMINDLNGWPKDWTPTEVQLKMHHTAFMMEAPLIFGKQFQTNLATILEKYGWKKMLAMLLSVTPRKFGKT